MFGKGDKVSAVVYGTRHVGTIAALYGDETCLIETAHEFTHPRWRRPVNKLRVSIYDPSLVRETDDA
jgi:hypothetical protein